MRLALLSGILCLGLAAGIAAEEKSRKSAGKPKASQGYNLPEKDDEVLVAAKTAKQPGATKAKKARATKGRK